MLTKTLIMKRDINIKKIEKTLRSLTLFVMLLCFGTIYAQSPCMPTVPSYTINLTGNPAGTWSSPNISRNDQCCSAVSPDQCVYFNLTLDPNTAGIQIDMIGADPAGSLFYDIGCSGSYPGGQIKCITGVGPHQITFCKPGSNKNVYKITSISRPLFPKDDTVRIGCKTKLTTLGIVNNTTTWQSIYPGTTGQYDNYLDSVNVASPTYSPQTGAPAYVDYKVCGFPIASGCGFSLTVCDTVRIYNYPSLTGNVNPNPATFCNIGPGSGVLLTGNGSGGLAPYSYTWLSSANAILGTGAAYTATAQGSYKLEIIDRLYDPGNCPSAIISPISVSVGLVPVVDAGASQKICASSPTAALSGTVQNASGGIWTGGAGGYNPGNTFLNTNYIPTSAEITAGFVKLYLTSSGAGGGCVNSKDSTYIYFSPTPTISISTGPLSCNNSTTTISALVSGGTTPYTYQWNTGFVSSSITGGEGNYSVIVKDSLNCTSINTSTSIVAPPALGLTFSSTNVIPDGSSTGTASVSVSGGTPNYSVVWSPGAATTFSINNLPYGVYTATVTDSQGCKISGSTVVGNSLCSGLGATVASTNVLCYGGSNASAIITPTGGVGAYTYTWNSVPEQNTATATNLQAGVYTAVVEDGNGCFVVANVVITEPTQLTSVITHTDVSVINGSDGSATANVFGGSPAYTYLWSNTATTSSITNLTAGTYTVGITDNNGCFKADNVFINQPPCDGLVLNVYTTNALCYGGKGSAFAVISGAKGTYTVNWSNGVTGLTASGLLPGNYWVSVTDAENCMESFNFSITQPSQLSLGLVPINVSCNGLNNGSIDLNISGGTFPYSFNWNSGAYNSEDLVNLNPGSYSVQVVDVNGCSSIASANITEPAALTVTYTAQNVSCIYGSNGFIGLNITGGVTPYSFTWSTGATTQSVTNLAAGGYTVSVKDANLCQIAAPLIIGINQPDSVLVDSFIVSCSVPGSNQTQVQVVPSGGYSGVYQVSFNNGLSYLAPGVYTTMLNNSTTYSVILKDANNCSSLISDVVTTLKEVVIDSIIFNKCYNTGTTTIPVQVYPFGGDNGPYSVSFDNGSNYLTAGTYSGNLAIASSYSVIIKDARSCVSAVKLITLPAVFNATAQATSNYNGQNISCNGFTDGSASATVEGGSGSYTYAWSSVPSQTTSTAYNLGAGTYSITIKDASNCEITKTVSLIESAAITATAQVTSNYNGQNVSCFGYNDGSADVLTAGGTTPYAYTWNSIPTQTTATASNLSAGTYSVIIRDANDCAIIKTVTLTQPAAMASTIAVTSNYNEQQVSCFGATDASVIILAAEGTGPYTYIWSTTPVQTGTVATSIGAGNYSVVITDVNGCNLTRTITVSEPPALGATTSITSNYNGQAISCFGLTDASANVNTIGGTAPYTFNWSSTPSQTIAALSNVGAGSYSVLVTDVNGCNITRTITINQPTAITAQILSLSNYNGYNISCFGNSNGSIDITVNGGTGAYTYTWSNAATIQDISNLTAGAYSVIVADANNCQDTITTTLIEPNALVATIDSVTNYNGYNISCNGLQDGNIYISVTGGVTNYTYTWSNNTPNEDITNVGAGEYNVLVTDKNLCSVNVNTVLTEPTAITYNSAATSPLCYGLLTGAIDVTVNGGVTPYVYNWSNGNTTQDLTSVASGTYSLNYTDANGCNGTSTITITQPDTLLIGKTVSNIKCYGDNVGSISLTLSGGTSPYTYSWSNGSSVQEISNLPAGIYTATVTDSHGCIATDSTPITQPDSLHIALQSPTLFNGHNISFFQGSDGSVELTVTGGVSPYTYLWSDGSSNEDLYNVVAGNYVVTVVDLNGCKVNGNIILTEPLGLEMPQGYSPNGDTKNDLFVIHGIEAYPDNVLTIYNRWGNIVYSKTEYLNEWDGISNNGQALPDGTYFAILEVNKGEIVLKGYVELRR